MNAKRANGTREFRDEEFFVTKLREARESRQHKYLNRRLLDDFDEHFGQRIRTNR
jgi:hypothetical protein